MIGLETLATQVREDLETLNFGQPTWVKPQHQDGVPILDVLIIGGGQSGLGAAFGLLRERISNILVIDENAQGQEGPWETYARMVTLRTPKHLTAIDHGIPSLTFRSYWQALHGKAGWQALDKIAREDWMAYLRWYRDVLALPVVNRTRARLIEPMENGFYKVHLDGPGATSASIVARKVVLATGIQGGGAWHVPAMIRDAVPSARYGHSSGPIDYAALKGARIGILGGGASAFDNANFALSQGVAEAHIFVRREVPQRVNPIRFMERSNFMVGYGALSDSEKYHVMASFLARNQPPTNDTFARAISWPGFQIHVGTWRSCTETPQGVLISTTCGDFLFDYLVLATGLISDPALRPELSSLASEILLWRNVYQAPDDLRNPLIEIHPYLAPDFSFQGRSAESTMRLRGLYAFNYSALISQGLSAAALSGLRYALPRLVEGIAKALFRDDRHALLAAYHSYDEIEFTGQWPQAIP